MERERKRDHNYCDLSMQILCWLYGSAMTFEKGLYQTERQKKLGTLPLLQKPRALQSAKPLSL
jgi:hypothetical protein